MIRAGRKCCGVVMDEHYTDRFTDRARRVVVLAQEEARSLGHACTGIEHLLLGLSGEGDGIPARALASRDISPGVIRALVEGINRPGWLRRTLGGRRKPAPTGALPLTPGAKKVLELSYRESLQFRHEDIGPEHILLALVRVDEDAAAEVFAGLGIDKRALRSKVAEMIKGQL